MTKQQKTQLDLSKYRTSELFSTISNNISLPGTIKLIIKWAVFSMAMLVLLVAILLKLTGNLTLVWATIFESYAALSGLIIGLALGIAEFIRRSLSNMTKQMDLLLQTTMRAAIDAQGLSLGQTQMPPTRDLVEDVYAHVILVITQEVLASMFGIFGKPVYWLYHVTLNQMVRITIKFIPTAAEMQSEIPPALPAAIAAVSQVSGEQNRVVTSLHWAQQKLADVGSWVKPMVMIPSYAIVALVSGLLSLPPLIAWWLFLSN